MFISHPIEVKTINYGLNSSVEFILFVVDINEEKIYYVSLKEIISKDDLRFKKQKTININIPIGNILTKENDSMLIRYAKKITDIFY